MVQQNRYVFSFSRNSLKKLRDFKKVRNINQLRRLYPNINNDKDIYKNVAVEYNAIIKQLKDAKLKQKQDKYQTTKLLQSFPINPIDRPIQKPREERIKKYFEAKQLKPHQIELKQKERYNRKAFNGAFEEEIYENVEMKDFKKLITDVMLEKFIKRENRKYLNCNIYIQGKFHSQQTDENVYLSHNSDFAERLVSKNQIEEFVNEQFDKFQEWTNECHNNSHLVINNLSQVAVQTSQQNIPRGGTYIELPDKIKNKNACVNIRNKDNMCFKWCFLAYKHYDTIKSHHKSESKTYKKYDEEFKLPNKVTYPIQIKDIPKIEKLNNVKINVFDLDNKQEPKVLYNNRERNDNILNLLLVESENNSHYVWIKNLDRLKNCHKENNHHKRFTCDMCLCNSFLSKSKLIEHQEICKKHEAVKVELPAKDKNITKFSNFGNKHKHPFYITLDFESTLKPVQIQLHIKSIYVIV
jgi:hypothetical protein